PDRCAVFRPPAGSPARDRKRCGGKARTATAEWLRRRRGCGAASRAVQARSDRGGRAPPKHSTAWPETLPTPFRRAAILPESIGHVAQSRKHHWSWSLFRHQVFIATRIEYAVDLKVNSPRRFCQRTRPGGKKQWLKPICDRAWNGLTSFVHTATQIA